MNHFTDRNGYNAIGSQPVWVFLATQQRGDHPFGAYFTTLSPETPNLAQRLRIPKSKLEFIFIFSGDQGLTPLRGGRGAFIYYSATDYYVEQVRQINYGETLS